MKGATLPMNSAELRPVFYAELPMTVTINLINDILQIIIDTYDV